MKRKKKAWLAASLLAGAAALTGCTAMTAPSPTPTPEAAQQITAQPNAADATVSPDESPAGSEETPGPITLNVDGQEIPVGAIREKDTLMLPLIETGKALGWDVTEESAQEETQTRRSISMEKDESRITVSWVSSDNTPKQITWQKDGLLIPVDTKLTSMGESVFVPAAFFETAMRVIVDERTQEIVVSTPKPMQTPMNDVDQTDKSDGENEG